ncbi:MAG: DUF2065 domain-containing protein, partial [Gammaproteobacteria bacterium]|nr:DUF2065 domain-containing protein [Gammaproteobacteria bacterium]
ALALLLVIEGIAPFLNPAGVRRLLLMINQMDDMSLRVTSSRSRRARCVRSSARIRWI